MSPLLMGRGEFVRVKALNVLIVSDAMVRLPFRSSVAPETKALPIAIISADAGMPLLSQLLSVSHLASPPPPSQVRVAPGQVIALPRSRAARRQNRSG